MMYDRQQELDNCRDYSNHKSTIIKTKDQTISMLAKDRKYRRRQLDKKERIIARLRHRISSLEDTIHERETCSWKKGRMQERIFVGTPTPISAMMMTFWRIRLWISSPMRMIS